MSKALEIKKDAFAAEVLNNELPVLVDFWATWCTPCQMMAPILDELAVELADKIKIVKVNTEDGDNQDLAAEYQIQSIPNMKLFKGGEIIGEFIGLRSKEALKEELLGLLG